MTTLSLALLGVTPVRAATVVTDFDLSGSSLMLGTVVDVSNGRGATVTGTARVVLTDVDELGRPTGPMPRGTLSDLDLTFDLDTPILAGLDARFIGPVRFRQTGTAMGTFDGMTLTLAANALTASLSTRLDCAGSFCSVIVQVEPDAPPPAGSGAHAGGPARCRPACAVRRELASAARSLRSSGR